MSNLNTFLAAAASLDDNSRPDNTNQNSDNQSPTIEKSPSNVPGADVHSAGETSKNAAAISSNAIGNSPSKEANLDTATAANPAISHKSIKKAGTATKKKSMNGNTTDQEKTVENIKKSPENQNETVDKESTKHDNTSNLKNTTKPKESTPKANTKLPAIPDKYAYRHYISLHPCQNKLLEMKWDEKDRQKHLEKIKSMKAAVDNKSPKLYVHLISKLKKRQLDRERQEEIERDNKQMLARMSNIVFLEAHDPEIHATKHKVMTNAGPRARARKLHLIALENKKLLERLKAQKPEHNRKELLEESFKRLAKLQNMSSFPQQYEKARKEYVQSKTVLPKLT